ncbi:vacuolar protein sorting-associated protein [Trifolium medium]|uniref:Vacuolar protein sorting-associated protein n=1 Tax=Trifolium medium TaxID=97028 RepID=A0A392NMB1_9FABA|nr:vacuolar protein sorting-associated protein [Trifolium medium]
MENGVNDLRSENAKIINKAAAMPMPSTKKFPLLATSSSGGDVYSAFIAVAPSCLIVAFGLPSLQPPTLSLVELGQTHNSNMVSKPVWICSWASHIVHASDPLSPSMNACVGNSAYIAGYPQPPNCGIWVAFIAASNTFIVLAVEGWI